MSEKYSNFRQIYGLPMTMNLKEKWLLPGTIVSPSSPLAGILSLTERETSSDESESDNEVYIEYLVDTDDENLKSKFVLNLPRNILRMSPKDFYSKEDIDTLNNVTIPKNKKIITLVDLLGFYSVRFNA